MAVEALDNFPASFTAGDTVRISISDSDYPSDGWTLRVVLRGAAGVFSYVAEPDNDSDAFDFVIPAADSAKLAAGDYSVTYIWTETSSGERVSEPMLPVIVLYDPAKTAPKSQARRTLEAMESALEKLAGGSNASVNFNGQNFTKKNLKELQDAIERQRAIVLAEEGRFDLAAGLRKPTGIGIRFAPAGGCWW